MAPTWSPYFCCLWWPVFFNIWWMGGLQLILLCSVYACVQQIGSIYLSAGIRGLRLWELCKLCWPMFCRILHTWFRFQITWLETQSHMTNCWYQYNVDTNIKSSYKLKQRILLAIIFGVNGWKIKIKVRSNVKCMIIYRNQVWCVVHNHA